jgi:DNA-binding CsgD family transcriptional regulator
MTRELRTALRERDVELGELERAVEDARAGHGRLLVVEGEAGIGKTSLLRAAREIAERAGMRVLGARGGELERDFPFSVARQLFEPLLFAATDDERERWSAGAAGLATALFEEEPAPPRASEDELPFRRRHGLYWLLSNLARDAPVAIAVDDAQWADEPSLGFLRHLATRLDELPVLLVVATRPRAPDVAPLVADAAAVVLRPGPLSAEAVAGWVRDDLGREVDEAFAEACHRATKGNPFLLGELLREVRAESVSADADGVERLRGLSPSGIATSVLLRLAGLPAEAAALARAAAVVGEAELAAVAEVAGLDLDAAAEAAGALARAGILDGGEPVAFAHPVVRTVLYEDVPRPERGLAHARAARTLRERGAGADRVAAQLALAAPVGEPWALATLHEAARAAIRRGAPGIAARLLERALAEAGDDDERFEVMVALGRAEVLAGRPTGIARLRTALELARAPAERVQAAVVLGRVLRYAGGGAEAVELLERAESDAADEALLALIRQELLATGTVSYAARRRLADRVERWWAAVESPPLAFFDRFLHAARAVDVACAGAARSEAIELAEAAIAPGAGGDHLGRHIGLLVAYAFLVAERFDRTGDVLAQLADAAAARSGAQTLAAIVSQRALLGVHRGHVPAAESDALEALAAAADADQPPAYLFTSAAALLWVATERGEPPHPLAAAVRSDGDSLFSRHLDYARAALDVADGRHRQGAAALLALGERERAAGWGGPSQFPWRSQAALALAATGQRERALELAAEELALARAADAPRALGVSLRARALLVEGEERRARLEEAVTSLEGSGADLEHARALVELGAELRRQNQATAAREPLRAGCDVAERCGASRLAERAREELLAAGARPRRVALRGRDALTPSELRVAELAARGLMNREIAQTLFVTEKTVETHLTHVYAKLGVRSRRDVAAALQDDP